MAKYLSSSHGTLSMSIWIISLVKIAQLHITNITLRSDSEANFREALLIQQFPFVRLAWFRNTYEGPGMFVYLLSIYIISLHSLHQTDIGLFTLTYIHIIWDKLFKNGPSKICGRQPLKNLKRYGLPKADHALSNFLKACIHKFDLVHSWVLCPI